MKKIAAIFIGLALSSSAKAAVVNYYLSLHEGSNGLPTTSNAFALYASVSQGDNAGLFAFDIDLKGTGDVGGPTTMTLFNRTPSGIWDIDPNDPNYNPGAVYPTKYAGFSNVRTANSVTGIVSGMMDLAKGPDLVPVYGFGQPPPHKMDDWRPAPLGTTLRVAYAPYVGAANSDGAQTAYGVPVTPSGGGNAGGCAASPAGPFTLPLGTLRIATGTWTGTAPSFEQLSVNTSARVWKLNRPSEFDNDLAQLQFATRNLLTVDCFDTATLNGPLSGSNQAVFGAIEVTGANNNYESEVDQLLFPSTNIGNAPIESIGDEPGNIYVMADLSGTAADIAAVLASTSADVDATDPAFAVLHQMYDSRFTDGSFKALFKFPNVAGAKTFNWALIDATHGLVTVDQLAVVPEPGMFAAGVMGLMGINLRRRTA